MRNAIHRDVRNRDIEACRGELYTRSSATIGWIMAIGITFGCVGESLAQQTNVRSSAYLPENQAAVQRVAASPHNNGSPMRIEDSVGVTSRSNAVVARNSSSFGLSEKLNVSPPRRQSFYGVDDVKPGTLAGANRLKVQDANPARKRIVQTSAERIVSTSIPVPVNRAGTTFEQPAEASSRSQARSGSDDAPDLVLPNENDDLGSVDDVAVESLEMAISIALSQSRTQSALAHKREAARAANRAATSLRNPKVNTTNTYVGLLNKPTTVSDIDVSSALNGVSSALPPAVVTLLEPLLADIPTNLQVGTPLTDRNFVTSTTSVAIPIYLGGRIRALEESASALTQAVSAGIAVDEQRVKLETTEAYFLVLRARQLHLVAQEAVVAAQEHLNDAERMYNVGMLTKNVKLAAQVARSEAQQLELRVANALSLAEAAYNRLLWRPLDAPVRLADVELGEPLANIATLTETALRTRNELVALNAEARAMQAQAKVARADVLPQVAAIGAYSYFQNSHLRDNSNATAAVGVTWTPFDGGTSRARQNAAQESAMAIARAREETESLIRLQVRHACLAENEARERLNVALIAAEQAEENYRVVTRGFQEGVLNHTEVLDAATMRTAAKSALANAKYDAVIATERVKCAVGVL